MSERNLRRSSRHPPSSYPVFHQPQRSRSHSNDKEPKSTTLYSVLMKEPKLSVAVKVELTPKLERRPNINELIERFDKDKSSEYILSPMLIRRNSIRSFSREIRTLSGQQKKNSSSQYSTTNNRSVDTTDIAIANDTRTTSSNLQNQHFHNSTAVNKNQPRVVINSLHAIPETMSKHFMAEIEQTRVRHPELYIKSQLIRSKYDTHNILSKFDLNKIDKPDLLPIEEEKNTHLKRTPGFVKHLEEIQTVEMNYVKKLYVLAIKVPNAVNQTCQSEPELLKSFNNIFKPLLAILKQLYEFHNKNILPNMEKFITGHRNDSLWSIFEEHFQTIEDLYKEYYIIYDENQQKFERLCATNSLLHSAMLECQIYLGNLYPISELNCANQHLLRYMLLMKTYMKYLEKDSSEYEHTCFVHNELTAIAERCQEHLTVSSGQSNKLKQRIDTKLDCFEKQQLIWHGSLKKQSPRKHSDISQVYLILFSECLIVCGESGNKLEVKRQLSLRNINIEIDERERIVTTAPNTATMPLTHPVTYYPFRVSAVEKSYEFIVDKESDREKWINKIRQASEEFRRRNSSIEIRPSYNRSDEEKLGSRAPVWVNDMDVTRCQLCQNSFGSKLISRRHHCRSCGHCICSSCSTKKIILKYCHNQGEVRVCDQCYDCFTGIKRNLSITIKITRDPIKTILFGDFRYFTTKSIVWVELQEDFQLHVYSAKLDRVEDFSINLLQLNEILFIKETQTFVLASKDKSYRISLEVSHQLTYPKNDYIDKNLQNASNKLFFYANLWYDTMQSARLKTTPLWYTKKRDSADSGISNN